VHRHAALSGEHNEEVRAEVARWAAAHAGRRADRATTIEEDR
jgi:hypothetical protein